MSKDRLDDRSGKLVGQQPVKKKWQRIKRGYESEGDSAGSQQFIKIGPRALTVCDVFENHARKGEIECAAQIGYRRNVTGDIEACGLVAVRQSRKLPAG